MTKPMTPERLQQIKARRQNITMGDGDWHRMKDNDGAIMPDCISAGQTKKGYSLDVIISEDGKSENMEFIVHCPADIDDCIAEIERLQGIMTILENIKTKHGLLESLSVYGPCKCKPGQLCMRHAALDIIGMINDCTELEQK